MQGHISTERPIQLRKKFSTNKDQEHYRDDQKSYAYPYPEWFALLIEVSTDPSDQKTNRQNKYAESDKDHKGKKQIKENRDRIRRHIWFRPYREML